MLFIPFSERTPIRPFIVFTALAVLLAASSVGAQAPADATSVDGTVRSEQGNPVTGATLISLHLPTGTRRVATSDPQGRFSMSPMLEGGPYVLQLSQPGFRSQVLTNVYLKAGQPVALQLTLVPDLVAVGTRRADRSQAASLSPVDVVDLRALLPVVPQSDLTEVLNYVVPSFNSTRQSLAYGTDHVEVSSLRGLAPDQTLVLLNGKRLRTTALINLIGNRGR